MGDSDKGNIKMRDKTNVDPMEKVFGRLLKVRERDREIELAKQKDSGEIELKKHEFVPMEQMLAHEQTEFDKRLLLDIHKVKVGIREKYLNDCANSRWQQVKKEIAKTFPDQVISEDEQTDASVLAEEYEKKSNKMMKMLWYKYIGVHLQDYDPVNDWRLIQKGLKKPEEVILASIDEDASTKISTIPTVSSSNQTTILQSDSKEFRTIYDRTFRAKKPTRREIVERKLFEKKSQDIYYKMKMEEERKRAAAQQTSKNEEDIFYFLPQGKPDDVPEQKERIPELPVLPVGPDVSLISKSDITIKPTTEDIEVEAQVGPAEEQEQPGTDADSEDNASVCSSIAEDSSDLLPKVEKAPTLFEQYLLDELSLDEESDTSLSSEHGSMGSARSDDPLMKFQKKTQLEKEKSKRQEEIREMFDEFLNLSESIDEEIILEQSSEDEHLGEEESVLEDDIEILSEEENEELFGEYEDSGEIKFLSESGITLNIDIDDKIRRVSETSTISSQKSLGKQKIKLEKGGHVRKLDVTDEEEKDELTPREIKADYSEEFEGEASSIHLASQQSKMKYFDPNFPELLSKDTTIYPSFTNFRLPYSFVCEGRIKEKLAVYKNMFMQDIRSLEKRHPFAFGGVQIARQFIIGIRVPRRFPDPLTPGQRERVENLLKYPLDVNNKF